MTNEEVASLVGGLAPAKIAHRVDPSDVLAGKASFVPYDGSDPKAGDALQFQTPHGTYQFVVSDDGSWQLAGAPKAPSRAAPNSNDVPLSTELGGDPKTPEGRLVDYYAGKLNDPDTPDAVKATLFPAYNSATEKLASAVDKAGAASTKAGALDATTQALALSAAQKMRAGLKPTQGELAALNKVRATQAGGTGSGQPSPFTQTGPGGSGNVGQTPVEAAVDSATTDPRVRMAMKLGASLEGGLGSSGYGAGDGGMSWGPFQINHNGGMHTDISREDSEDPAKAAQYMLAEYQQAVERVPAELWDSNPKAAAAQAAYYAERPAKMYDPASVDTGWNSLFGGGAAGASGGGMDLGGLGLPGPSAGLEASRQADAAYKRLQAQELQQKLTPKAELLLSQQYDTIKYIETQLAAGSLSPSDAHAYMAAVRQQTAATLAGTTAYDIYKDQQDEMTRRAQIGKDLLDTQVTASGTMINDLLSKTIAPPGEKLLVQPSTPFDYNALMGAAKANIEQYEPSGLTQTAQQLIQAIGGGLGTAPGQTDQSGAPLVPPGTDQGQPGDFPHDLQPQETAA